MLIPYVPFNNFQLRRDTSSGFNKLVLAEAKCLAQGHNEVTPMRLEPATPRSRVKYSTPEPPLPSPIDLGVGAFLKQMSVFSRA